MVLLRGTHVRFWIERIVVISLCLSVSLLFLVSLCLFRLPCKLDTKAVSGEIPQECEIPNFYYVHDYLLRGGQPTAFGMEWLKENGVKTIVDLRKSGTAAQLGEAVVARDMGFEYVNLPTKVWPSSGQLRTFEFLVNRAEKLNRPLFVHCSHGSDRTGFYVATARACREGWSFVDCAAEMLSRGFVLHRLKEPGDGAAMVSSLERSL